MDLDGLGSIENWPENAKQSAVLFSGKTDEEDNGIMRYWDDAHARDSKLSVYGFANVFASKPVGSPWYPALDRIDETQSGKGTENWQFPAEWKDYSNDAVGTMIGATSGKWTIGNHNQGYGFQDKTSVLSKDDIAYSNNLSGDGCLKFDTGSKKFTSGVAQFHRAMALFTINIVAGEGFDISKGQFKFSEGTNVAMNDWNKQGYLNIKTGGWHSIGRGNWTKIDNTNEDLYNGAPTNTNGKYSYTLLAFVIPGNDISTETTDNALRFIIDGNEYKISKQMLYNAIKAKGENCVDGTPNGTVKSDFLTEGKKIKAGINYEFTFTVGKTKIQNIAAKVIDWQTVGADLNPSNARITLSLQDPNSNKRDITNSNGNTFSLYRLAQNNTEAINDNYAVYDWNNTGYTNLGANLSYVSTDPAHWRTDWFWDDSKNFYHFRALGEVKNTEQTDLQIEAVSSITTADASDGGDYIGLQSGLAPVGTTNGYKDICWGAPFAAFTGGKTKFTYSPYVSSENKGYGFDGTSAQTSHQINKAIGATKDAIKLVLFHMMSEVKINIKTTTDAAAVTLEENETKTKVEFVDCYSTGKVLLGNGLVIPTETTGTTEVSRNSVSSSIHTYMYGVIPQDLTSVKLRITTPDNNQYMVALKDAVVAEDNISNQIIANPYTKIAEGQPNAGKYTIDRWYPGFKYTYNLTLKKTGIDNITATVVDWEEVTADYNNVQIQ